MSNFSYIYVKKEDNLAYVTINKPPANAISYSMLQELDSAFDQLLLDDEVKVVLLHGEGRFFAAGADIKEFTQVNSSEDFEAMASNGQKVFTKIEAFPKPVISIIHGAALGGGLELAMATHLRLVADDAKLGLPELQLGLIPGFGGTQRLPKLVGKAKATEMILSSAPVTGLEAVQLGLANQAYSQEVLLEEASKLAKKIAAKGAVSVRNTLELLSIAENKDLIEGQKKEAKKFGEVAITEDATEGIQAFIEKRKASFKDR